MSSDPVASTPAEAIGNAHRWFEANSGWAPPDPDTLFEWVADGVCRAPDDCLVAPDGWCGHGLASWWLILRALDEAPASARPRSVPAPRPERLDPRRPDYAAIIAAHEEAVAAGAAGYCDPSTGLFVLTAPALELRGSCCDCGCRHCPYPAVAG